MTDTPSPRVLFVDLDGTVRHGKDELGHFVEHPDHVAIFPEALTRMRAWKASGGYVIGISNQGGVGMGYLAQDVHEDIVDATIAACDGQLDEVVSCIHAPAAGCWCRKPLPGMFFAALAWLQTVHDVVEAPARSACLMVGDLDADREAAAAAGIPFLDAATWRAGTGGNGT